MATKAPTKKATSKTTTRSASTTRKSPAKKASAKKPVIKKPATKKVATKKAATKSAPKMQSLKLAKATQPFMTVKMTHQTLYWIIISLLSLSFALWVLTIQTDINRLYDQIEVLQQEEINLSERLNV